MEYTLGKFKATDVFTMATLLSKIGLGKMADGFGRDNVMKLVAASKGKKGDELTAMTGMGIALQMAEIILGNIDKCQVELFTLLANISGLTIDEIKDMDAEVFAQLIFDVVQLPQFKDFIKVASRFLNSGK